MCFDSLPRNLPDCRLAVRSWLGGVQERVHANVSEHLNTSFVYGVGVLVEHEKDVHEVAGRPILIFDRKPFSRIPRPRCVNDVLTFILSGVGKGGE